MEHRFSSRLTLPLQVALYARGALVTRGVCRDVSRDGMFVFRNSNQNSPREGCGAGFFPAAFGLVER